MMNTSFSTDATEKTPAAAGIAIRIANIKANAKKGMNR